MGIYVRTNLGWSLFGWLCWSSATGAPSYKWNLVVRSAFVVDLLVFFSLLFFRCLSLSQFVLCVSQLFCCLPSSSSSSSSSDVLCVLSQFVDNWAKSAPLFRLWDEQKSFGISDVSSPKNAAHIYLYVATLWADLSEKDFQAVLSLIITISG